MFLAIEYDGCHVGNAGIKCGENGAGEIWYYIGEQGFRGKGIASRAVGELVRYAAEEMSLSVLEARVLDWNAASIRVLEKNGFKCSAKGFGTHRGTPMLRYCLDIDGRGAGEASPME